MGEFREKSISQVWYFGHAAWGNIWLNLTHINHESWAPSPYEIIKKDDIKSHRNLKKKFIDSPLSSKFYGCNTLEFAEEWTKVFKVPSQGAEGKINFEKLDLPEIEKTADIWKQF